MTAPEPGVAPTPISSAEATAGGLPEVGAVDVPRRGGWFIFVATFAMFASMLAALMPALYSLAVKTQAVDPHGKEFSLGLIVAIGSAVSIFTGPMIGHLSDASRSRLGRRRPFLVAGIIVASLGYVVIALASSVPMIVVGWVVALIGAGGVSVAFQTIIVEHVPEAQRGRVGALGGVATQLAGVAATLLGALLVSNMLALFLAPSAVLVVAALLYWFTVPESYGRAAAENRRLSEVFTAMVFNPRKHPDFGWVWIGKFFIQFGVAFFSTYQIYFLLDRLGLTAAQAGTKIALVGGIGIIVTSGGAVFSGWLSDRIGRRKVFIYLAGAFFTVGLAVIAFAPSFTAYMVGGLFVLAGSGVFGAVDLALASDVMPKGSAEAGRFMNVYGMATSLANALAPAVAPVVLLIGGAGSNYTALYITAAVVALGGTVLVSPIRKVR